MVMARLLGAAKGNLSNTAQAMAPGFVGTGVIDATVSAEAVVQVLASRSGLPATGTAAQYLLAWAMMLLGLGVALSSMRRRLLL